MAKGLLDQFHDIVLKNRQAISGAGAASRGGIGAMGGGFASGMQLDQQRAAQQQQQQQSQDLMAQQQAARAGMMGENAPAWMQNMPQGQMDYLQANPQLFDKMVAEQMVQSMKPLKTADTGKVYAPIKMYNDEGKLEYAIPTYDSKTGETGVNFLGETPFDSLDAKTQAAIAKAGGVETAKLEAKKVQSDIDAGFRAYSSLPDIDRSIELAEKVSTSGFDATVMDVQNYFGVTPANKGELNNLLAQNVLDGLSAFTGAISEGERAFIEKMQASVSKGQAVNVAILKRLQRIAKNTIAKAKRTIRRKGGDNMQYMLDEFKQKAGSSFVPPQDQYLLQNPQFAPQYDAKYGAGASAKILGK